MSLGMEVLKTTMRNGVDSCRKRSYPSISPDGITCCAAGSRGKPPTNTSDRVPLASFDNEQPIARICIDKRLIPPKVARLKSGHAARTAVKRVQPPPPQQEPQMKNEEETTPSKKVSCLQCSQNFSSEDDLMDHNGSPFHLRRLKIIANTRLKLFNRENSVCNNVGISPRLPRTPQEPRNWRVLVDYCQSRGKRLDFNMRGGFTGADRDVFLFEVDISVADEPFSGVGLSLNEAKQDVASRALSSLSAKSPPLAVRLRVDDFEFAEKNDCREEDTTLMRLRDDLYIVLERLSERGGDALQEFSLQVLNALCQIAASDDRLVGAMPVGNTFKGLYLPGGPFDAEPTSLEMLVFCACWPTHGLVAQVLQRLRHSVPGATFRGPQLWEKSLDSAGYSVKVHFISSKGMGTNANNCEDYLDREEAVAADGEESTNEVEEQCNGKKDDPLPEGSCVYARNLLTAARRFKRRIAVNQSAVAVLHILMHLYHMHHLLVSSSELAVGKVSDAHLESLLDYWLLVRTDASMEWLFCRALHSLAYDQTLMEYATPADKCPKETATDCLSAQLLAKYCLQLILEQRLIEAFSGGAVDTNAVLSSTNPS